MRFYYQHTRYWDFFSAYRVYSQLGRAGYYDPSQVGRQSGGGAAAAFVFSRPVAAMCQRVRIARWR